MTVKQLWKVATYPFRLAWLLIGAMWIAATTHLDDQAPWRDSIEGRGS